MSPPSSRAALDSWLDEANWSLAEQRASLLSPSQTPGPWDDRCRFVTTTVAEVEPSLADLLRRHTEAPGRWIVVVREPEVPGRYIQFICYEDGCLLAEAVSNEYLPEHLRLDKDQESTLARLGWQEPSPPDFPNWVTVHPTVDPPVDEGAARAVRTLGEVFGLGKDSSVVVKVFTSAIRRDGPLVGPDEPRVTNSWSGDEAIATEIRDAEPMLA